MMCCVDKDKDMRELADKVHEYTQFRDDLRKLVEEIKYNHGWLAPGLDRYTANIVAEAFDKLLQVRRSAQLLTTKQTEDV